MLDILEKTTSESVSGDKIELGLNFYNVSQPSQNVSPNMSGYNEEEVYKNVQVILLCVLNKSFKLSTPGCELKICGKTMREWVKNAVSEFDATMAEFDSDADFLPVAKQNAGNKKYTLILFSDTPLVQSKTIKDIIEYFVLKDLSVLKFDRGYIFKTEYLNTIEKLFSPQFQSFDQADFLTCSSLKQFALASEMMKNRILSYHQSNGVVIVSPSTTFIDADVTIDGDVVIKPNNKIYGQSKISSGTILDDNNIIENSVVLNNCKISGSVIKSSVIQANSTINSFCYVDSSIIESGCTLNGYNYIEKMKIASNTTLNVFEKKE